MARLGIFCSSLFCGVKCSCCTSIIKCLCCCCIRADKIGPYSKLYQQASEKIQRDFDILEHIKCKRVFEASLKALAVFDKKRTEKMQYIRDCIIDVDLDPKKPEEDDPTMQPLDGIDYNEVDRNIEAQTYGVGDQQSKVNSPKSSERQSRIPNMNGLMVKDIRSEDLSYQS